METAAAAGIDRIELVTDRRCQGCARWSLSSNWGHVLAVVPSETPSNRRLGVGDRLMLMGDWLHQSSCNRSNESNRSWMDKQKAAGRVCVCRRSHRRIISVGEENGCHAGICKEQVLFAATGDPRYLQASTLLEPFIRVRRIRDTRIQSNLTFKRL